MVIRLVAVPDSLDLTDFDDIFHAMLGWDSGIGFAFQIQGQEFNSFRRKTRSKKLRDFRLHRQEKFLYTLGALDQWEWELRVVDLRRDSDSESTSSMPRSRTSLVKSAPKMPSQSRRRYRGASSNGKAPRSCCPVHSAVGCAVTLKCTIRLRS